MNYQETFMIYDGLVNLSNELAVSILPEYKCKAGCKTCRIASEWPKHIDLNSVVIPEKEIFNVSRYFNMLCVYDDLEYIKTAPHLFDFYKRNENKFYNSNLTDRAIPKQLDILLNEITFLGIQEISLFDHYIVNPKLEKTKFKGMNILDLVKRLEEKYKIKRIKIMLTNAKDACNPKVDEVHEWAKDKDMDILYIGNFLRTDNSLLENLKTAKFKHFKEYEKDPSLLYFIEHGKMWKADSCGLYLINDRLDTNGVGTGISKIYDFDAKDFIYKLLNSKLINYTNYSKVYKNDYFNNIAKDLIVNKDYNFIPAILMKPYFEYTKRLLEEGFIKTRWGLYKPGKEDTIIPVIEWRSMKGGL